MANASDKHTVILGAGFSRAISTHMPLMIDLVDTVVADLRLKPDAVAAFGGDLESWLSFLSSSQPWLSESENLRNRALYIDASEAIFNGIERCEQLALAEAPPIWLQRLVWLLSDQAADVLTFNYDLLLERMTRKLGRANGFSDLYVAPLTERSRPGRDLYPSRETVAEPHLRLYKLHGSTNWYGVSEGAEGSGLSVVRDNGGWEPDPSPFVPPEQYADLGPMIIPPLATKTPFYKSPTLRSGWVRAAAALKAAGQLTIIGYSLPITDSSTAALLTSHLNPDATVTVVDYSRDIANRITKMLAPRHCRIFSGVSAVSDYVSASSPHHIEWGIEDLPTGGQVPRLFIDGVQVPQSDLPGLDDLAGPTQWPPADRFARWVGDHYPHAPQRIFHSEGFKTSGGSAFSYDR